MPHGNATNIRIFMAGSGAPEEVKVNGVAVVKEGSIAHYSPTPTVADEPTCKGADELVGRSQNAKGASMLLVQNEIQVDVRLKISS